MSRKVRIQCKDCATEMMTDGGDNEGTETLWCPKCHPGFCPKCGREDTPAASLRARPQEPGLITREFLETLMNETWGFTDEDLKHWTREGRKAYESQIVGASYLINALLDSLKTAAPPSGPLSDEPRENEPICKNCNQEMVCYCAACDNDE